MKRYKTTAASPGSCWEDPCDNKSCMTASVFIITKTTPIVLTAVKVCSGFPHALSAKFLFSKIKRAPELREKKCMKTFTSVSFLGPGFTNSKRDGLMVLE